ncbi:MAG: hypothetical protein K2Q01_01165 [Rickettsiales bacterium]|nr:hypothetical protein [Rickettsiales bacterium]
MVDEVKLQGEEGIRAFRQHMRQLRTSSDNPLISTNNNPVSSMLGRIEHLAAKRAYGNGLDAETVGNIADNVAAKMRIPKDNPHYRPEDDVSPANEKAVKDLALKAFSGAAASMGAPGRETVASAEPRAAASEVTRTLGK